MATIHGNLRDSAARERLAGFYDAHAGRGMAAAPELVVSGDWRQDAPDRRLDRALVSVRPPH